MRGPSGGLMACGGGGFGVTLGGFDLGVGSGLDSSASAGTSGWMSNLATGKRSHEGVMMTGSITGCEQCVNKCLLCNR